MDAFVLPALGLLIVAFMVVLWNAWLKNEEDRALHIKDDDGDDSVPPSQGYS